MQHDSDLSARRATGAKWGVGVVAGGRVGAQNVNTLLAAFASALPRHCDTGDHNRLLLHYLLYWLCESLGILLTLLPIQLRLVQKQHGALFDSSHALQRLEPLRRRLVLRDLFPTVARALEAIAGNHVFLSP